jgi:hypothetical protein
MIVSEFLMAKNEHSSVKLGQLASKVLRDPRSPMAAKKLAGSVLTQRPDKRK